MHDYNKLVGVAAAIRLMSPSQKIVLDWVASRQILIHLFCPRSQIGYSGY